jgi:hypothetical protein
MLVLFMIFMIGRSFLIVGTESNVGGSLVGLDVGLLVVRSCNLIRLVPGSPSLMSMGIFVGGFAL